MDLEVNPHPFQAPRKATMLNRVFSQEIKMAHPKNSTDQHTNQLWISKLEESTFKKDEIDADECYDSSQPGANKTGGDLSEDIGTPL